MPRTYSAITAILAAVGSLALMSGGEVSPVFAFVGIGLIPGYYHVIRGKSPAPRWVVAALSLLALGIFAFDVLLHGDVFLAVAHLTIVIQVIKSLDLREPWDHLQVYFVSLLQLVIVSEMTSSVVFAVIFVVFMAVLVAAMVFSHFLEEGVLGGVAATKPVAALVLLTIACTMLFFVLLPRTPYRFVGKGHLRAIKTAGFSERVDLGSFGTVKLDPTVIMRIEIEGGTPPVLYWRGLSLDYFDGTTWRHSDHRRTRVERQDDMFVLSEGDRKAMLVQRIYREPIDAEVIFGLSAVSVVKSDAPRLFVDSEQGMYLPGRSTRKVYYTVYSNAEARVRGRADTRYLQLPAAVPGLEAMARRITTGAAGMNQQAGRIQDHLRKNYAYSLTVRTPPAGVNPIEDFLFNTRQGYCEHYATAMVLLLRSLAIPARIVTGFYGGERNAYGDYIIVRKSDAHAWVEALIDGRWKRFDPTPAAGVPAPSTVTLLLDSVAMAWSRYVVGFNADDQRSIVRTLVVPFSLPSLQGVPSVRLNPSFFVLPAAAAFGWAVMLLGRRLRDRRHGTIAAAFLRVRRTLRRRGYPVHDSTTAGALRRLTAGTPVAGATDEFTRLYEEGRFGGKELTPEERRRYLTLSKAIGKAPVRRGQGRS